jgi:endo-1,4-beta-D-glucanase Y
MKTGYGMIIPSRPEPGHSGCNQCLNISALLMCFGSFVESRIYSWLHSGHFTWNCFLESFLSIMGLLVSTYDNYTIN